MENNITDDQDILKNTDANVDESADTQEQFDNDTESEEDVEELKSRIQKLEEDYHNQKVRAEKAESKFKNNDATKRGETSKFGDLSAFDLIAVTKANLDEDALKEAMDYAKYKKISVAEAIKTPAVKAIIANIEETKKTAEATSTGYARRGTSRLSDDTLLYNSQKGIMPDSDEDIERLIKLRRKR